MRTPHFTIAYRWAQGDVPRNGLKGHNMYCDQETIYSYGPHFPIADRRDGCILVNADSFSKSTLRHQSYVRSHLAAAQHLPTFTIPRAAWGDKKLAVRFYRHKLIDSIGKWQRSRKYKDTRMDDARHYLAEFRRFCEFHKIDFDALLQRDTKLALTCAIIALNPGG